MIDRLIIAYWRWLESPYALLTVTVMLGVCIGALVAIAWALLSY